MALLKEKNDISHEAAVATLLPGGIDARQQGLAYKLVAALHQAQDNVHLPDILAHYLCQLVPADRWTVQLMPEVVRAAFNLPPAGPMTEPLAAPPAFSEGGNAQRHQDSAGSFLFTLLILREQVIGYLEGARAGASALPFSEQEAGLLDVLAVPAAHALARAQRLADLERLSYTDELTQLYNERYWREWLAKEISRAHREQSEVAVLFFDLDNFKDVNDEHGHLVGSHVLQECGEILRLSVRDSDVAARYGGDEFVIILPGTGLPQASVVAERLRHNLAQHNFHGGQNLSLKLRASFGIACYPAHALTPDELIARADAAMYAAKAAGKNCLRHAANEKVTEEKG